MCGEGSRGEGAQVLDIYLPFFLFNNSKLELGLMEFEAKEKHERLGDFLLSVKIKTKIGRYMRIWHLISIYT